MKKDAISLYACPSCKGPLELSNIESDQQEIRTGLLTCKKEGIPYAITKGIANLITPARREQADLLAKETETIRQAQGLAIDDWAYYTRLPYPDTPTGETAKGKASFPAPLLRHWRERAATFEKLYAMIRFEHGKTVLDLGAGCCWLASRLANRFKTIAMDIDTGQHGLGMAEAFLRGGKHFERCRGELANIPLADKSVDIAVTAAAIEYEDLSLIIQEAKRVLKSDGTLYIIDSPVFNTAQWHGRAAAILRSYYEQLDTPLTMERHQPLLMSSLTAEFKASFTVELIPAERNAVAAKRSFLSMIKRREFPLYPIIKARKVR